MVVVSMSLRIWFASMVAAYWMPFKALEIQRKIKASHVERKALTWRPVITGAIPRMAVAAS